MLETNVLALLTGCKAAVIAMRKCGAQGHIVNMSSVSAQRRNSGVYGATKPRGQGHLSQLARRT